MCYSACLIRNLATRFCFFFRINRDRPVICEEDEVQNLVEMSTKSQADSWKSLKKNEKIKTKWIAQTANDQNWIGWGRQANGELIFTEPKGEMIAYHLKHSGKEVVSFHLHWPCGWCFGFSGWSHFSPFTAILVLTWHILRSNVVSLSTFNWFSGK